MAESEIKKKYLEMLNSGDLLDIYPFLAGSWSEDKDMFISFYLQNETALGDDRIGIDDLLDDQWENI